MTVAPQDLKTRKMLAGLLVIGKMDEAAQIYRDWLVDSPEDPTAQHLHAACTGEGVPERADDAYIRETYNSFAETFDTKLKRLETIAHPVSSLTLFARRWRGSASDWTPSCVVSTPAAHRAMRAPDRALPTHRRRPVGEHAGARLKARSLS
jgi:hypothetical protein